MEAPISRRSFLVAGAGLAVVGAAACGKKSDGIKVAKPRPSTANDVNMVIASYIHTSGIDQRVTFAFLKGDGPVTPDQPVTVTFAPEHGPASTPQPAEAHHDSPDEHGHGDGQGLPYFVARHRFDTAGIWTVKAAYGGTTFQAPVNVTSPEQTTVPFPGRPLVSTPTPTVADGRDVNPICTRQPACPLHDVSLDAALAERRPLAVLFATPALCQSRLCGPTLENLLSLRDELAGRVRMLHVEIYTDLSGRTLTPAVQAYHLDQEPFLFLAGADGVVRDRLDNAVDTREMRAALTQLISRQ